MTTNRKTGQLNRAVNLNDVAGTPYDSTNPFPVKTPVPGGGPGSAVTLYDSNGVAIHSTTEGVGQAYDFHLTNPSIEKTDGSAPADTKLIMVGGYDASGTVARRFRVDGLGRPRIDIETVNGTTIPAGNGPTTSGSPRVTIASDNSPFPVNLNQYTPTDSLLPVNATAYVTRGDTFSGTGTTSFFGGGVKPYKYYAIQVTGSGAPATAWSVNLELSLDSVGWTSVITHATGDGDGKTKWMPTTLPMAPAFFLRSNCTALTLGGASNIIATLLAMN